MSRHSPYLTIQLSKGLLARICRHFLGLGRRWRASASISSWIPRDTPAGATMFVHIEPKLPRILVFGLPVEWSVFGLGDLKGPGPLRFQRTWPPHPNFLLLPRSSAQ